MKKNIGIILSVLSCNFLVTSAWGNPTLGSVASGIASITSSGTTLTIGQSSSTSIINWGTFNIAGGETTLFVFPTAASSSLNLVAAGNPSTIAGLLESTVGPGGPIGGTVMLLNPAGVLFTSTAQVNVGSLVATTLGLPDQNDFLNGQTLHFSTPGNLTGIQVQNGASLSAVGDIFLIAHTVQNAGTLTAGNEVGLAAGTTVTLLQPGVAGAERLSVVAGSGTGTAIGVDNTAQGQINAVTTELKAAGGNIYALAINNGGAVRATSVVSANGNVYLRATDSSTGNNGVVSSTGTIGVDGVNVTSAGVTIQGSQVTLGSGTVAAGGAVNAGSGAVSVTTTSGNGVNGTGNIIVNNGITGSSVSLHSGTDGTGNIEFGAAGVPVQADTQSYQAGIGNGTASTAQADLTGQLAGDFAPSFLSQSGSAAPASFTFRQDATIADVNIPSAAQFGGTPPATYTIQSDGGNVTLATGGKVAGSALTLSAFGTTAIDDNLSLFSLVASGASIQLNGTGGAEAITTTATAGQTYNNPVVLGANTTLSDSGGGDITFNSTVDGAHTLEVDTAGNEIFNGVVGGNTALTSLTTDAAGTVGGSAEFNMDDNLAPGNAAGVNAGTVRINDAVMFDATFFTGGFWLKPTVRTSGGGQYYAGAATMDQSTALADSANGSITFNSTVDGPVVPTQLDSLLLDTMGVEVFNGVVGGISPLGSLVTDYPSAPEITGAAMPVQFNMNVASAPGGRAGVNVGAVEFFNQVTFNAANSTLAQPTIRTSGNNGDTPGFNAQEYHSAVTLQQDTILADNASGTIQFDSTVDGAHNLTVNTLGQTTFEGAVGGVTPLASLTTDNQSAPETPTLGGVVDLNGGVVNTTGDQDYNSAVKLTTSDTLTSTAGNINFAATVDDGNAAGSDSLTTSATAAGKATTFGGAVGGTAALKSLTVNGTADLNGGVVNTTGDQDYNNAVNVGASDTLTSSGGNINFASTVDDGNAAGSDSLTTSATAAGKATTFAAAVGGTVALKALTVNGTADLNGGVVNTTGDQDYNNAVKLTTSETLTSTGGNINFASTVDDGNAAGSDSLTTSATAVGKATTFAGAVGGTAALKSLTVNGTADLNGGVVNTTGDQDYNNAVKLTTSDTLTSTGGNINFASTVDDGNTAGSDSLTTSATAAGKATTFAGAVGGTTALKSLTVNGTADLNGGAVNTTGDQDYNNAVNVGANDTLTSSGGNINFASTVNDGNAAGSDSLTTSATAAGKATTFAVAVGGVAALKSLTVSGTADLNGGSVQTTGNQQYNNAVKIGTSDTLTSSGGSIIFGSTVDDGNAAGSDTLTTSATAAGKATTFGGAVGGTAALKSLTVNGTADLNGGVVNTTGDQDYNNAANVGADDTLTSTGGNINFASTVNDGNAAGSDALTTSATAAGKATTFATAVGGTAALKSLTVNGTADLNGGVVNTTGDQDYNNVVKLGTSDTLTSSGGNINFASTVDDGNAAGSDTLTTSATAAGKATTFAAAVGGTAALKSLTVNGTADLNGGVVNTTGDQDYNNAVKLGTSDTLTSSGGNIDFASTVNDGNGAGNDALITSATTAGKATTFGGAVGGTAALKSLTVNGTADLNGGVVNTTGDQDYNNAVTVGANDTLASSGGNINFASTVNDGNGAGKDALTTSATAAGMATTFFGAVGGTAALQSLTVNGAAALDGGAVTTTGSQTYNGNASLGVNTSLTGTTVALNGNLTGGGNSLNVHGSTVLGSGTGDSASGLGTVALGGNATINDGMVNARSLTVSGTTALNGGNVTAGAQSYGGGVTLGADNNLSGGSITFSSSVTGADHNLTLNNSGAAVFESQVNGVNAITVSGDGTLGVFGPIQAGSVSSSEPTTLAFAGSTFDDPTVNVSGQQIYTGPVILMQNTILGANPLAQIEGSVTGNGFTLSLESTVACAGLPNGGGAQLGTPTIAIPQLTLDEDERRILAGLAPREKKAQVRFILPIHGKRIINIEGYLKGSSDVPVAHPAAESTQAALIN